MISTIWNKSKKIIPNNFHTILKNIYTKIFSLLYPNGYYKKFNFLDIIFLIKVNPKNGPVDNIILLDGVLDGDHLKIIKESLNKDGVFIDAGANIGQYSLFASQCVGDNGKVIAFEPVKDIFNQFKDSVTKNNINNIILYNKACGCENDKLLINKNKADAGGATLITQDFSIRDSVELVEVIVLDDILSNENKIDFIKIDVEGFEYEVLLGLEKTIRKYKPILLIEYSPQFYQCNKPENSELILKYLKDLEYDITDLTDMQKINLDTHYKNKNIVMTYLLCK